jgi:hypothetical protein
MVKSDLKSALKYVPMRLRSSCCFVRVMKSGRCRCIGLVSHGLSKKLMHNAAFGMSRAAKARGRLLFEFMQRQMKGAA